MRQVATRTQSHHPDDPFVSNLNPTSFIRNVDHSHSPTIPFSHFLSPFVSSFSGDFMPSSRADRDGSKTVCPLSKGESLMKKNASFGSSPNVHNPRKEFMNPPRLSQSVTVMKPGEKLDVTAHLDLTDHRTCKINIPITAFTDWVANRDFTWGYFGDGPYRFAFNILMHWTGGEKEFAEKFAPEFLVDFVQPLPDKGGTIRASEVTEWISEARNRKPKTQAEYLPKSYRLGTERQEERNQERIKRQQHEASLKRLYQLKRDQMPRKEQRFARKCLEPLRHLFH
jgi:hypothetical protein